MRLARAPGPLATLRLLGQIDATRAPLHPLLLQAWLQVGGVSESWARSFSALCGVLTVATLYPLGRRIGDRVTGLWAAAFAALSPLMIEYSRETRMYALLVLLTCLAWWALLALRDGPSRARLARYAAALVALAYTHPLGVLMGATLAAASLLDRRHTGMTLRSWFATHLAAGALVAPWLVRYLDHAPEFLSGRLPLRFLIGVPIGFTGGDSRGLVAFAALIGLGLIDRGPGLPRRPEFRPAAPVLLWLLLPPTALYAYSWIGHPIFGPSRYNLFVAPAYLLLLARGITRMSRGASGLVGSAIVAFLLVTWTRQSPPHRADWKWVARESAWSNVGWGVVVPAPTPGPNREVDVARYYLGDSRRVIPGPRDPADLRRILGPEPKDWLACFPPDSEYADLYLKLPVMESSLGGRDFEIRWVHFPDLDPKPNRGAGPPP